MKRNYQFDEPVESLIIYENMSTRIFDNCLGCDAELKGLYDLQGDEVLHKLKQLKMGVKNKDVAAFYIRQDVFKNSVGNTIFPICPTCLVQFKENKHQRQSYFRYVTKKHVSVFYKPEEFKELIENGNWKPKYIVED